VLLFLILSGQARSGREERREGGREGGRGGDDGEGGGRRGGLERSGRNRSGEYRERMMLYVVELGAPSFLFPVRRRWL